MVSKATRRLNMLKKLRFKLNRKTLERMYVSFIRPLLEYADPVWDNNSESDHSLDPLDKIQHEAARAVTGATARCTTISLYNELHWQTLKERRLQHRLSLFYKIINKLTPVYLFNLIPLQVNQRTTYNLRNRDNLDEPISRVQCLSKSFIPATIKSWNSLPPMVRDAPSVSSFNKRSIPRKSKAKTNKLYYYGRRLPAVHHTRIRMGCSALRSHLFNRIGVVDSPMCACGIEAEDAYHYLLVCQIYKAQRTKMLESIYPITSPSLPTLLHGDPKLTYENNTVIFDLVHEFITATRRFF
jgi:hypothetical protein